MKRTREGLRLHDLALAAGVLVVAGAASGREVPFARALPSLDSSFTGASALAVGDLDGDGVLDVIGAAESAGEIAWWRGSLGASELAFFPRTTIDASFAGARGVTVGDIDRDGDLDVVGAAGTDMEVAWWSNDNGDGTAWTKTVIRSAVVAVRAVTVTDIDRDGDLDVVAAMGGAVRWFDNTAGDGTAWTNNVIASGTFSGSSAVAVGDLDDDGDIDVAAAAATAGDVAWFESSAGGATWTRHDLDTTFPGASSVAVADIDGDGSLDVAATSPTDDQIVWWDTASGTSRAAGQVVGAASVDASDLDGDGDLDLAVGGENLAAPFEHLVWLENTAGDGTVFSKRLVDGDFDQALAVATVDLDHDGDSDIVGASFGGDEVAWWRNATVHGSALFRDRLQITSFPGSPTGLAAGDLDGDGDVDLVTSHSGTPKKAVWLENGGVGIASWTEHDLDSDFGTPSGWAIGDINGDGRQDVVAAYGAALGRISWYENDGTPTVGEWTEQPIDGSVVAPIDSPSRVAVADIDRDGDLDVVASIAEADVVAWYSNDNGDGSSWTRTDIASSFTSPKGVQVGDLDGDGDPDVVVAWAGSDEVTWYSNDAGDGSSWTETTIAFLTGASSLAVADVDDDGDVDVYVGHSFAGIRACFNDGTGATWTQGVLATSAIPSAVTYLELADLDRDGDLDTTFAVNLSEDGSLQRIDRRPFVSPVVDVDATFAEPRGLAVADFDRDGDLDLAALSSCASGGCSPTYALAVWENVGGQFSLATTDSAPPAIPASGADDVLTIDARHLGRDGFSFDPLDSDVELAALELLFEDDAGAPLGDAEMNALFDRVEVWLDDELAGTPGAFDGSDVLVTTVASPFSLSSGVLTVPFSSGDANVQLQPDDPSTSATIENIRTYFVVTGLTADADSQTPSSFQVTHLTESSSRAQDATGLVPLTLEWAENVATDVVDTLPLLPDHLLITNETLGGVDVREACLTITAGPDVVIESGSDVTFRAADLVSLDNGFSVEGGTFSIEMNKPAGCP